MLKKWPLPKDRKVAALRQRNRRGNLQNWVKADKYGNSKATQIVAFLSENILVMLLPDTFLIVIDMVAVSPTATTDGEKESAVTWKKPLSKVGNAII